MTTVLLGATSYALFVNWICRRLKEAGDGLRPPC